jgi:hypothetical protein
MINPNLITFTINDQEIPMIFNNSSLNAMSTVLFGNQSKAFDLSALLEEINRINAENFMFACKVIIYSGVVGYSLESDSPKPMYSFSEVGKLVGNMTEPELIEYTGKIWDKFLNDLGVNLEKLQELESEQTEKKK